MSKLIVEPTEFRTLFTDENDVSYGFRVYDNYFNHYNDEFSLDELENLDDAEIIKRLYKEDNESRELRLAFDVASISAGITINNKFYDSDWLSKQIEEF